MLEGFTTASDELAKYYPWDKRIQRGAVVSAKSLFGHRNAHLFREFAYRTAVATALGRKSPGQISAHGPILANVTIPKGSVLYAGRLDSGGYTKKCIESALLADELPPANLRFAPVGAMYDIDRSINAIRDWAAAVENPSLLVVECLGAFFEPDRLKQASEIGRKGLLRAARLLLKSLAAELGIAVLIVFESAAECATAEGHNLQ